MNPRALLLLSTTLAGCSSIEGVWLMELQTTVDAKVVCDSTVTENLEAFDVAQSGGGGGTYTETYSYEGSSYLFFVEIVESGDGATMAGADLILPGTRSDDGSWKFSWNFYDSSTRDLSHEGGYLLHEQSTDENIFTFELQPDGDEATGHYRENDVETFVQQESDTWSEDVAGDIGSYGDLDVWAVDPGADENRYDSRECEGDTCEIKVEQSCMLQTRIRATRTDADDLGDFAALQDFMNDGEFSSSGSSNGGGFDTWQVWDTGFRASGDAGSLRPLLLDPMSVLAQDGGEAALPRD